MNTTPAPRVHNTYHRDAPPGAVYIGRGRGSTWGNPYEIGEHGDRAEVIAAHRADLFANAAELRRARAELAGKPLVCFCAPAACHGHALLWVASCADDEFERILAAAANGTSRSVIVHHLASTAAAAGAARDDTRERRAARKTVAAEIALLHRTSLEDAATVGCGYAVGTATDLTCADAIAQRLAADLFAGKRALLPLDEVRVIAEIAASRTSTFRSTR